jgi:hypothetical protein
MAKSWKMPATIDDPAILDEVTEVLAKRGLKKQRLSNYRATTRGIPVQNRVHYDGRDRSHPVFI